MRCPRCGSEQEDGTEACGRCGVYFSRYRPRAKADREPETLAAVPAPHSWLRERMFEVEPSDNRPEVILRAAGWLVMAAWGLRLASLPVASPELMESFLHWIHIPFHEAGHFVFRIFWCGSFMHILGGTLGQLLVPLGGIAAFLREGDPFGAAFGCWWLGTSFMDCSPYIDDARARVLPLLSGETGQTDWEGHDWYQMLSRTGLLEQDHLLARCAWLLGVLLVLAALAWGAFVVWKQWGAKSS